MTTGLRSLVLLLSLLLPGCAAVTEPLGLEDPFAIPRVFQGGDRDQRVLNPQLGVISVVVEVPRGLEGEVGVTLQDRVIRALTEQDIAGQAGSTVPTWTLKSRYAGTFRADRRSLPTSVIVWRLYDKDNVRRGQFTTTHTGSTLDDIVPRLADQAKFVSTEVVALVTPGAVATDRTSALPAQPQLVVGRVKGAPGDGNVALAFAIKTALMAKGVRMAPARAKTVWQIDCSVAVVRLNETEDRVRLVWRLRDPERREAGVLEQENPVPRGRLRGKWGDVATFAAEAAADGIWQILQQIPAESDK